MPTTNTTQRLHEAVAAVCPIIGVRVLAFGNPGQAQIVFNPAATAAQQTAATSALAAFDWSVIADQSWDDGKHPERTALAQLVAAVVAANNTYVALAAPTAAQTTAQVKQLTIQCTAVIKRLVQLIE